jgi:aryl-alcohol dehydrogenase-like predicted oxidoreductase
MKMVKLGRTELQVSEICLGTMTWGEQNSEAEGHAQMDYAVGEGVNFLDCAELYPIPPNPETKGRTEEIIGSWMKARNNRSDIVVATKMVGRSVMDWFRTDGAKGEVSRSQIVEAVDASLKRLQTDYIDLYQIHWPDRAVGQFGANPVIYNQEASPEHPIPEQLETFAELVKAGKIRHLGISNESTWGLMDFVHAAETRNLPRIATIQNGYNLLNRTFETNLAEATIREEVSLLAYSPLGQGVLTGKYLNGALPRGSRKQLFDRLARYQTPNAEPAIAAYVELSNEIGIDPVHLALQFVTARPFVASNIIGATSLDQLKTALASRAFSWSDDVEARVNEIHLNYTNPCP